MMSNHGEQLRIFISFPSFDPKYLPSHYLNFLFYFVKSAENGMEIL